ncbi:MAG: Fur family transcriptional regulator [Beijerinckiaceae bacterium]
MASENIRNGKPPGGMSPSEIVSMLQGAGLRPTRQRQQIARLLYTDGGRHVTAEMLYAEARSDRYPPSLATIYNALRDFAEHGLLREVALYGSKLWYDTTTGPHFHYYVENGETLFDIPPEHVPQIDIVAPEGMRVAGVDVVVRLEKL